MKLLLTGIHGTVAPAIARHYKTLGAEIASWDRTENPWDDADAMTRFVDAQAPDLFIHCAMGAPESAATLARLAGERGIRFVFTSTVSVFSEQGTGPYNVTSMPNAEEPYGKYKRECEAAVAEANPQAWIPRLGWQIGDGPGSNNMVDFLYKQMHEKGVVEASTRWFPSCSHLDQTARAIETVLESTPPGISLVNANRDLSFFDIVTLLARRHAGIAVRATEAFVRDDRMIDARVPMVDLAEFLGR